MSTSSEAQLKDEIARLTASINLHKSKYNFSSYSPANKYIRPAASSSNIPPNSTKEVVLNGVAFQSSARSLVRKDRKFPIRFLLAVPQLQTVSRSSSDTSRSTPQFTRKSGHLIATTRVYKPHSTRGRRGGARNMSLNNNRRPYQSVSRSDMRTLINIVRDRRAAKRLKYMNKPCPRFSTTGACSRGLTCVYQHDPSKIAICWNFLQDNCQNTADSCNLSHEPTPERTPLCLHFLNKGRCTREKCPYPHVNVGARHGVCRDFAVLGYCEKGLDCDKQHVRECPDFAEKGTCSTKGCKLPHVIRANRTRKPAAISGPALSSKVEPVPTGPDPDYSALTADNAQIGDEYISLTFNESESSEEESDDEDEEEENVPEDEDEEQLVAVHT